MHHQRQRGERHRTDRDEILVPAVWRTPEDQRAEQERPVGRKKERIAIGRRLGHCFAGDHAARPRPVLDDERLAEDFLQTWCDDARRGVDIAAGGIGHDQPDRLVWPFLRGSWPSDGQRKRYKQDYRDTLHCLLHWFWRGKPGIRGL